MASVAPRRAVWGENATGSDAKDPPPCIEGKVDNNAQADKSNKAIELPAFSFFLLSLSKEDSCNRQRERHKTVSEVKVDLESWTTEPSNWSELCILHVPTFRSRPLRNSNSNETNFEVFWRAWALDSVFFYFTSISGS